MSMLLQYAEAIQKAQKDRDLKVLAIIAGALKVEPSAQALADHKHRISKHVVGANHAERFFVDGKPVAFATLPVSTRGVSKDGVVTITASYEITDETKP